MPSSAEGVYPLSTPGFHIGADWACSLSLKSTSEFSTKHGRALPISCGECRQCLYGRFLSFSLHP